MNQKAKIFINGRSQAVRLPSAFRFDSKEVYIRRDEKTGDVILSKKPENWDDFFLALENAKIPADFLNTEERKQNEPNRDPFEGWKE